MHRRKHVCFPLPSNNISFHYIHLMKIKFGNWKEDHNMKQQKGLQNEEYIIPNYIFCSVNIKYGYA